MALKLDSRQTRQRTKLDQLSTTTDLRLDAIMNLINDELTMPLRMRANLGSGVDGSPDQRLYIDSIFVKTLDSGAADNGHERSRTIPPIGGVLPNYSGSGYIEFNATTGAATASGLTLAGSYSLPSMTNGQFVKVLVWLSATSKDVYVFGMEMGVPAASVDAAVLPVPPSDAFALGYVVMTKGATTYSKVLNENIFQFVGGGGSGGGSGASKEITQANSFKVGNVVYYNGSNYVLAQADTGTKAEAVGMVSKASSTKFTMTELGYISGIDVANVNTGGGNLTPGEVYFLSATEAGKIVVTEPATIGNISKPMLIADSTTSGYVLNYRGATVGSVNARSQVSLVNNGTKDIQNVSAYDAGQLMGWVYIAGTTNYRFHVTIQFSKNGAGSDYNVSYQTSGDTPPAGFNIDYNSGSSNVRVTLPLIAGYSSGVINYSLNGPAVGATFPLTIDGNNVPAATASSQGTVTTGAQTFAGSKTFNDTTIFKTSSGTIDAGSYASIGAWTFGPTSGGTAVTHLAYGQGSTSLSSGAAITAVSNQSYANTDTTAYTIISANKLRAGNTAFAGIGVRNTGTGATSTSELSFHVRNSADSGSIVGATMGNNGAWSFGQTSGSSISHIMYGGNASGTADADYVLNIRNINSTSATTSSYVQFVRGDNGTNLGKITQAGATSVAYTTTSDERLKTDFQDFAGTNLVCSLPVYNFAWKETGDRAHGVKAQEAYAVYPEAVSVGGQDPSKEPWSVDYSKLTPVLVKAIQELKAELDAVKAELAELKK